MGRKPGPPEVALGAVSPSGRCLQNSLLLLQILEL